MIGKKWFTRRKILTPGFHFTILNKYTQSFLENSIKMVEDLKKEKDCVKNVETWISQHTLAIICGKLCKILFKFLKYYIRFQGLRK